MIQGQEKGHDNGRSRWLIRLTAGIMTFCAGCVIILEILLSTQILTDTVNRFAGNYIDGDISFGKVSASLLKNFPSLTVSLEDLCITYPSDRFDESEKNGPQGALMYRGCGEESDTLATFSRFSTGIRVMPLIFGHVNIPEITLEKPVIYAHSYSDGRANWNIFISGGNEEQPEEVPESGLPDISIGKIRLADNSQIVYTDSRDSIFALVELKQAEFDGDLSTGKPSLTKVDLSIDSLFVAGRIASDTLAMGMDRLRILEHAGHMDFETAVKATVATQAFGRIHVPIEMSGTAHFPKDTVPALKIEGFKAGIADIPLSGEASLRFHKGRTAIDGKLSVTGCKAGKILEKYIRAFIPDVRKIKTDAIINMDVICQGEYINGSGIIPECAISINIPETSLNHRDFPESITLALDASATSDGNGKIDASVTDMHIKTAGLDLKAKGGTYDAMSDDPLISVNADLDADLARLAEFLPKKKGMESAGRIAAEIKGKARMSQLSLYTFSHADLEGNISSDSIVFSSPADTIDINASGIKINLGPETVKSRIDPSKSFRLIGITASLDKASIGYRGTLSIEGEKLAISAKNSVEAEDADTANISRLGGRLSAAKFSVRDDSGTRIRLSETSNSFQMMPKRDNPKVPVISVSSSNKRITLLTETNRAILTDAGIKARATLNTIERRQNRNARLDSLQKIYPDTPRDSLFRTAMKNRPAREIPEWMKEEDFRKQDISITLDKSLAGYFREWDMNGSLDIRTGILMTPYFPLRNILRGCMVSFDNDRIAVDSLKVVAGESEIAAKGSLSGLRRSLLGRGSLQLDMDISSGKMNANELLAALNSGSNFSPGMTEGMSEVSDAEFLQMVTTDTTSATGSQKLIVIPANLNADITLNAKDITYSDLSISELKSCLTMKERCVQITNSIADSNIGDVTFEGFYATRSKKDIRAGFNFGFKDITAEKAIDLIPAVDSIMPLLKSFAGKLNCELAATASLDTNMTVITPSINGVVRISGDNLSISGSEVFTSLAKKLKFNNKETGHIRHMTVEGVIKDNILEVFPFVASMDRYTLALSGKQNLDRSYRYHASIIRSPMIIKVGVDIYGKDFDNMKFKIGKAKYKNEKVPVFSAVIDQTRINLAESIRNIYEKGVEAAVRENEQQNAINDLKSEIGYVNAVDQNLEELSEEEKVSIEGDSAGLQAVPSDTTEVKINNQQDEQSGIH